MRFISLIYVRTRDCIARGIWDAGVWSSLFKQTWFLWRMIIKSSWWIPEQVLYILVAFEMYYSSLSLWGGSKSFIITILFSLFFVNRISVLINIFNREPIISSKKVQIKITMNFHSRSDNLRYNFNDDGDDISNSNYCYHCQ